MLYFNGAKMSLGMFTRTMRNQTMSLVYSTRDQTMKLHVKSKARLRAD